MKKLLYLAIALIFISCNNNEITKNKSTITGNTFDVLLVMTDNDYQSNGGQDLYELLNSEIAGLPQSEPHFKIIRIRTEGFSNLYANYRNMVWVELGDKYALEKLSFINNPYAIGQKMIKITAPNQEGLTNIVKQKGQQIIDYFYTAERNRTITHFRKYKNEKAERLVQKQFGLTIAVPQNMAFSNQKEEDNFIWLSNNSGEIRQDLVIYSLPLNTENLTQDFVLTKADSVFQKHIAGPDYGSYITTEYRFIPPVGKKISFSNGDEGYEVRGLWHVENGTLMGGPFINITRIDKKNYRIIAMHGFVFAPSKNKRNSIQQLEAMIYSTIEK